MFLYAMLSRFAITATARQICRNARMLHITHNTSKCHCIAHEPRFGLCEVLKPNLYASRRFKHKKSSKRLEEEEDLEKEEEVDEDEDIDIPAGSETLEIKVNSLRMDVVCKTGFHISRGTVDAKFYNSDIRINGMKLYKKHTEVKENDEIDIVQSRNIENPAFIIVNRLKILETKPVSGGIKVKISRDKSLMIEDYSDPWHGA